MGDQVGQLFSNVLGGAEKLGSGLVQGAETLGGDVLKGVGAGIGGLEHLIGGGVTGLENVLGMGGQGAATSALAPAAAGAATSAGVAPISAALTGGAGDVAGAVSGAGLDDQLKSLFGNDFASSTAGSAVPQAIAGAAPAAAAAAAPAAAKSGIAKFLLPGLLVGGSLLKSQSKPPGLAQLEQLAGQQLGSATTLNNTALAELTTGQLPSGYEASIASALADAHSAITSNYASLGLTGSTMEQQDLQRATQNAEAQKAKLAQELAQQGLAAASGATGQADQLYTAIMNTNLQQDQAFGSALGNFLTYAALSGG